MKVKVFSLVLVVAFCASGFAQQGRILPFGIKESTLIDEIRLLRSSNPRITPAELASAADALFRKNGIAFRIYLDATTCQKIRSVKQSQKDPNAPINLGVKLQSVGAEKANIALPQPTLTTPECGDCYVEMPVLEITDLEFVTLIQGHNIKLQLPGNFSVDRGHLLDTGDPLKKLRTWRVPFRAAPIGVSSDGNVLYLGFENAELSALSLAVFESGGFEITTRAEAEDGGPGKTVKLTGAGDQGIRFDRWKNTYLVSYRAPC